MSFSLRLSQLDPLPQLQDVEYAKFIKYPDKIFAVKFVNRAICHRSGMSDDDIGREVLIHQHCSKHPNIIKIFSFSGDHPKWLFMVMELATGGDLFDKIEPDIGVDEEISHFYFRQLINAVEFLHNRGVAHRDIKPENILLDNSGNLKLADFGLASVYKKKGSVRLCYTPCGSPPYMAPELEHGDQGYNPGFSDIWSCGVVLFVLLTGETPWEEPTIRDPFYRNFLHNNGNVLTRPWNRLSLPALSILRAVLRPEVDERSSISQIRNHIWFNKVNKFATEEDLCKDGALLTVSLLENLHIGLKDEELIQSSLDDNKYDSIQQTFVSTQPVIDMAAMINDEIEDHVFAQSQQVLSEREKELHFKSLDTERETIFKAVSKDPAILQFSSSSRRKNLDLDSMNLSSAERLTRFFSILPLDSLLSIVTSALNTIGIPTSGIDEYIVSETSLKSHPIYISIQILDRRKVPLRGSLKISRVENLSLKKIDFIKTRGDPLEWRRLFKRITLISREAVFIDDE
ncbi:hypothetical protein WICMUC_004350 [Wickerhamomyces mucosus]|uniref:non-specific serine/threonine protein kinase n=1 Tax=Wickerhamomyces mucosus TaxID=1378264 RepID=A0A9P8PII8_9ASCO|nr:hypothetical protein WICMUC_004350 [Wickerhamomyces mucosus]